MFGFCDSPGKLFKIFSGKFDLLCFTYIFIAGEVERKVYIELEYKCLCEERGEKERESEIEIERGRGGFNVRLI